MRGCGGPDGTRQWEGTRRICESCQEAASGQSAPEGPGWQEALRNWVSEAIRSPWAAALFLKPGCSGFSPQHLPGLLLKPSRLGHHLTREVGTPSRFHGWPGLRWRLSVTNKGQRQC